MVSHVYFIAYVKYRLTLYRQCMESITKFQRDNALAKISCYKAWFLREVVAYHKENTIVIVSSDYAIPRYRAEPSRLRRLHTISVVPLV